MLLRWGGHEKGGPPKGPAQTSPCPAYLPNDPTGQKTTGHKQGTRAEREERRATRARKLATRSRRSGTATASSRGGAAAAAAAAAAALRSRSGRSNRRHRSHRRSRRRGVNLVQARVNLRLGQAERVGDVGGRSCRVRVANDVISRSTSGLIAALVLVRRGLVDVCADAVLDHSILVVLLPRIVLVIAGVILAEIDARLGEGRSSSGQHHGQDRCQQHYFPQLITSCIVRITLQCRIFSSPAFNVNTNYRIFYYFLKTS